MIVFQKAILSGNSNWYFVYSNCVQNLDHSKIGVMLTWLSWVEFLKFQKYGPICIIYFWKKQVVSCVLYEFQPTLWWGKDLCQFLRYFWLGAPICWKNHKWLISLNVGGNIWVANGRIVTIYQFAPTGCSKLIPDVSFNGSLVESEVLSLVVINGSHGANMNISY